MASEAKAKLEQLNNDIEKIPGMKELSEMTNLPAGAFVGGVLLIGVVLVGFDFSFSYIIVNLIGVVYPICKSI